MAQDWIYIDDINTLPAADYVHCDTRDFHVLCNDDKDCHGSEKIAELKKQARHRLRQDTFKFRRDEILGVLKALEMGSGGRRDWRMLRLKPSGHYDIDWLKYIRFVAIDEEVEMCGRKERIYIAYCDDCGRFVQLGRTDLNPENIDPKSL